MGEKVELRTYRGGDERGIIAAWNESLRADPIDTNRFVRHVLADTNFRSEGLQIAVCGKEIIGFALAVQRRVPMLGDDLEHDHGWITAFGVRPDWQGRRIGYRLIRAAEEFLKAQGVKIVGISPYAPNYFWPGVDEDAYAGALAFLKNMGYETRYVAAAMDRSLVGFMVNDDVRRVEAERRAEGYSFESMSPASLVEVATFAEEEFSPDWGRALRETAVQSGGWERTLIVRDPQGSVVGFATYGGYEGPPERYGPFGVASSQRGKGLGKILLYRALESMWAGGLHSAWFLWTGEHTAAGGLYLKAGFEVTRRFHVLQKSLG